MFGNRRLSWQIVSDKRNTVQTAYEIVVRSAPGKDKQVVWNSGKVTSQQSVYVPYLGSELKPNHKYLWQVKIWDNHGKETSWSEAASWQTGFRNASDWKAKWIESTSLADSTTAPALLFRKQFRAAKKVQSATAYITSHGMYEAMIKWQAVWGLLFNSGLDQL